MKKSFATVLTVLILAALCLSGFSLYKTLTIPKAEPKDVQYVLYLGTNDKDTNQPVFTPEEARRQAQDILVKHFGGYTIQEANGGWVGDDGALYQEYTLVLYLSDTTPEAVHAAADDMISVFNQSSVLIQANETRTEFYSGK